MPPTRTDVPPTVWFAPDNHALTHHHPPAPAPWVIDRLATAYARPTATFVLVSDDERGDWAAPVVNPVTAEPVDLAIVYLQTDPDPAAIGADNQPLDPARLRSLIGTARAQLRDGGTLAVRAPDPLPGAGFLDRTGQIITAAQAAGLGYLQHIVAVNAALYGTRIIPAPARTLLDDLACAREHHAPVHARIHTDYLIFAFANGAARA